MVNPVVDASLEGDSWLNEHTANPKLRSEWVRNLDNLNQIAKILENGTNSKGED